ncbi:Protein of unknown function precursor containing a C-terminal secretion signal. Putative adhesin [Tenacibaculum sp. 190130A14a]|uniref:T9SS type B sorting domain-containing protein n=3 Tax=Tenacibaculum polynesiense TaxID=3137857 RepID=UPI0032B178E8
MVQLFSSNNQSAGTTYYRVVITDSASGCNSVTSNEAEVIVNADPSITAQPTATQTVCEGGTATVSVTATGGVSLSYQWQSSTTSGGSFSNIASANSASYSAPTTSAGTTYYRVVITDSASGCNSVTSGEAEVIVNADPSITAQPTATQTVCEGGTATVSVTATGGVSLSYQWQSSTTSGGSFSNIASANSASYSAPTTSAGTTYYRVVITDSASGCNSVTSGEAEVIVSALPSAPIINTIVQPTCDVTNGTINLNGLPTGNWTLFQTGTSSATYNGSTTAFSINTLSTGSYNFTVRDSNNCTASSVLTVVLGKIICGNDDDYSGTAITAGDSTTDITDNDTLDGVSVVIGTNPGEVTVNPNPTGVTNPSELSLDPSTGVITVAAGTPSGTYTYTYEICENGASPTNCDTATVTILVANDIVANDDDYSGTAITAGDSTTDITDNDTLDGVPIVIGTNPGEVTVNPNPTGVTNPSELSLDPSTGVITVAAGTPSGTYTYTYEICENGASPTNCDTATVTILVANDIVANDDDYSGTAITAGDSTTDITDNDTLDGVPIVIGTNPGEVTVNPNPTGVTNPSELSLDPSTGVITVAAGTPSGTYTYTYEICENGASPTNCDTATVTILVANDIVANDDDYSGTAITAGDSTTDITDNDTLDGVPIVIGTNPGEVTVNPNPTGVTNPSELSLDPSTGVITVAAGTPSGTYTYTYEICENGASPTNCDTATVTILVANDIVANDDDYSGTAITAGDSTTDITDNDTLDGVPIVIGTNPGEVTVNPNPTGVTNPSELSLDPSTGVITVAAGTPSGTYTYTYEICENGASPTNCDTATVTILVANDIVANDDDYSGTAITAGDSTTDITDNDTLDGVPIVIGTNPGEVTVNPNPTGVTNPSELSLDPSTGVITVAAGTPSGTYTYTYEICENGASPTNCDTATVTILVANDIVANDDDYSGTAITAGDSTTDITDNDTLDGVPIVIGTNPGEVTVNPNPTGVTNPSELSLDPSTGVITVAAGTPSGTYTYTYEICENGASPTNCDTATVTILVANDIVANDDDYSGTAITAGDSTTDITDNDTLDGVPIVIGTNPGEVTVNPNPTGVTNPSELSLDPSTGVITVAAGTPSGTYTYTYEICENGASPTNCDTATVTILVANDIVANDDDYSGTAITAGDSTTDITDNDTLDGVPIVIGTNPGEVTVNPNPTGVTNPSELSLDPSTGVITVAAGTPSGTYTYTYEICENGASPTNCDTATVTILVANDIVANDDDYSGTAITAGDSTTDITDNDTLDGVPIVIGTNPGEVTVNPNPTGVTNPSELSLDPSTGVITVAAGTPSGTYTYTYEICENGASPTNCDTAVVTILVANDIVANDDDYSGTAITAGDSTTDITDNDTLDGVSVVIGTNPGEVTVNPNPTGVTNPSELSLDPSTGVITVAAGTPSGTYTYTYEICENGASPTNCDTAVVTILVANDIVANDDDYSGTAITAGDSTTDITDNDTLDGVPIVIGTNPGEVTVNPNPTGVTNPSELSLDPSTGVITVAAGTPSGTYTYTYEICENGASPTNCDTAVVTILVANDIVANDDDYSGTAITAGDSTTDITDNDTLDGVSVVIGTNPGEVTVNPNPTGVTNPSELSLDPSTGVITVAAGTPSGTYTYTYEICENGASPTNCDTATVTIVVLADTDEDGVPDIDDLDDDNDGILDVDEGDGSVDTDGDGIPDSLDPDSDNDGVLDVIEGNDDNGDGIPDVLPSGEDSDGDGIDDVYDPDSGGDPVDIPDSDGDGTPDFQDTDDDNDGIDTIDEGPGDGDPTTDDALDTNENGIPDYLDTDTNPCGTPYNILTPDGDGDNDIFYISCIDDPQYQNNTVEIFNRWGNTVYKASGYNNEDVAFRGISNGRANINVDDKLPSGTYYYVIDLGDGSKPKVGWLYINR